MNANQINDLICRLAMPGMVEAHEIRAAYDELLAVCGGDISAARELLAQCDDSAINTALGALLASI